MKKDRLSKIIDIVKTTVIETQDDLTKELKKAGYDATQATISRDMQHLRLIKVKKDGKYRYAVMEKMDGEKEKYQRVLKEGYKSHEVAKNIIVIKTLSGMANAVAAAIDGMDIGGVAGTIAGDDTIFIATTDDNVAIVVARKIDMLTKG